MDSKTLLEKKRINTATTNVSSNWSSLLKVKLLLVKKKKEKKKKKKKKG